jgi:Amt family ammonium transporter
MGTIGDVADISRIFSNTNAAAAGGVLTAIVATQLYYGKIDLTMALNGALAGLVSITAEPLFPSLGAATLIGAVGGLIVVLSVPILDKFKIDDVVGAIPVHLIAGIWGTLAVTFNNPEAALGTQLYGIIIIGAFTFLISLLVFYTISVLIGLRSTEEDEIKGLDASELGMDSYPDFSRSS